jgi:hypothetical protein
MVWGNAKTMISSKLQISKLRCYSSLNAAVIYKNISQVVVRIV